MKSINERIQKIEERNKKVELDKGWEISLTRKIILAILTYLVIVLFLYITNLPKPFVNAIVPTMGFVLSTLSLPIFKRLWMKHKDRN